MSDADDVPVIEVTIAAPPDQVWRALRDPDLIRRWHGWQSDGLDDEVRLIYFDHATADPDRYTLVLGDSDRFTLHPVDGGTVVRITRAPIGSNPEWDAYYDDINEGWTTFLRHLRFGLERHALAERRTLLLNGAAPDVPVLAALGLAEAAELPVGARYRAPAPTGDVLTGEVYARTGRQWMFTVDGPGDGLLIVTRQPAAPDRPDGQGMVLLTVYGLGDDEFAALEGRWTAWWESVRGRVEAHPRGH
jgi:hypothetical protein